MQIICNNNGVPLITNIYNLVILERKNEILQWIEEEKPKSFMCQQLQCK